MNNLENKSFGWMKLIPILAIVVILIFAFISVKNDEKKRENEYQQYAREYDARRSEREVEIQRHANIALNPMKVKCINLVFNRLSATDLLKILIKYEPKNTFDSYEREYRNNNLRYDISSVLNWDYNVNFSDTIAGYIVGEDIYFRMPNETSDRKINVSSEEMIRWTVEYIYSRKRDLENIPANERNRSYISCEVDGKGDIVHKIIKK